MNKPNQKPSKSVRKKTQAQPKENFIKVLKPLANTPVAKKLVEKMSELVISASIEDYTLKPLSVEHQDYNQGKPAKAKALVFKILKHSKDDFGNDQTIEYKLIIGNPCVNKKTPHDLIPFSEYGYLQFGWEQEPDCTLWGEKDLSVWTNDEYKLEGVRDKKLQEELMEYNECLIENSNTQWVVMHDDRKQLAIITGLLNDDFDKKHRVNNQLYQIDLIEGLKLGEIYFRLMAATLWGMSARKALQNKKIFDKIK